LLAIGQLTQPNLGNVVLIYKRYLLETTAFGLQTHSGQEKGSGGCLVWFENKTGCRQKDTPFYD